MVKSIGGFEGFEPAPNSFAARVKRAENPDAAVDESTMTAEEKNQLVKNSNLEKEARNFKFVPVEQALEHLVIIADDSSSMEYGRMQGAIEGMTEFMRLCKPNETAIAIQRLNKPIIPMTTNLPQLADKIKKFTAAGSTPLYTKLKEALMNHKILTRIIAFSDGEATDVSGGLFLDEHDSQYTRIHDVVVELAKERKIPIDTCYIATSAKLDEQDPGYVTLKRIADETGGVFIVCIPGKLDFKKGFKYLTKGNRLLLMDTNFKSKLEAGEI